MAARRRRGWHERPEDTLRGQRKGLKSRSRDERVADLVSTSVNHLGKPAWQRGHEPRPPPLLSKSFRELRQERVPGTLKNSFKPRDPHPSSTIAFSC